jgi:hypothetical protein
MVGTTHPKGRSAVRTIALFGALAALALGSAASTAEAGARTGTWRDGSVATPYGVYNPYRNPHAVGGYGYGYRAARPAPEYRYVRPAYRPRYGYAPRGYYAPRRAYGYRPYYAPRRAYGYEYRPYYRQRSYGYPAYGEDF